MRRSKRTEVENTKVDLGTFITVAGALFGFLGALVSSLVLWKKSQGEKESTDTTEFRADILEFTASLTAEINNLRDRIHKMEEENIVKNKTILALQLHVATIARALITEHNMTIEQLLGGKSASEGAV